MTHAETTFLALADSESYLKWAARLLDGLPWAETHLVIIDSPIRPTDDQVRAAVSGTRWEKNPPSVVQRRGVRELLRTRRPDIVLAAATGPVVEQIFATAAGMDARPALISGLPGVGLPATTRGALHRRFGDAFITHSRHEADAYASVYAKRRIPAHILVSRLPLLASANPPQLTSSPASVDRLIFAPQAKVPAGREERLAILRALDRWVRDDESRHVVVKLRSRDGEHETHHERFRYRDLLAELRSADALSPRVTEEFGPMSAFLTPGSALVTVSSTAALESLDQGLPTLIISDFGVNEQMLNIAFAGSGLDRTLAQMVAGDFPYPTSQWLTDNYFHPIDGSFAHELHVLARRTRERQLPPISLPTTRLGLRLLRAEARTVAPQWVVRLYRAVSPTARRSRRRT